MAIGDDFNGTGRSEPAPARHHEPFQKTFFFRRVRGAAGRPPGERQEGRLGVRCGTPRQTEPQERRTSPSVLGARRGRRCRRPPPASYGGGRCSGHRRVLCRPNSDALSNTIARTLRTRRVAMPIGKVRPGHREAARRGLQPGLGKNGSSQGRLAALPRPTRPRGSTTAGRDRIDALGRRLRQTGDVGWIANEADPGGGGRARARPAWRPATIHTAKGAPGDHPGAANEP